MSSLICMCIWEYRVFRCNFRTNTNHSLIPSRNIEITDCPFLSSSSSSSSVPYAQSFVLSVCPHVTALASSVCVSFIVREERHDRCKSISIRDHRRRARFLRWRPSALLSKFPSRIILSVSPSCLPLRVDGATKRSSRFHAEASLKHYLRN